MSRARKEYRGREEESERGECSREESEGDTKGGKDYLYFIIL